MAAPEVVAGVALPDYADVHAPLHPVDECLLQEAGQPHARAGALLFPLQLVPAAQGAPPVAGHGVETHGSPVVVGDDP